MNVYSLLFRWGVTSMPALDKTGPRGQGSVTGRGLGLCTDGGVKKNRMTGRKRGLGVGRGRELSRKDQ